MFKMPFPKRPNCKMMQTIHIKHQTSRPLTNLVLVKKISIGFKINCLMIYFSIRLVLNGTIVFEISNVGLKNSYLSIFLPKLCFQYRNN